MDEFLRERGIRVIGIKKGDIDKDILMIFVICYEYSISFMNMLKLFEVSRKYFWTFMEICSPMIKMGVRKATTLRKSVDKMMECLRDPSLTYETLTPREDMVLEAFTWFIEDNFSDGEGCLHISQFERVPFAKAYGNNDMLVASDYKSMVDNVDRIKYIQMGDGKFFKTSRFLYFMEKYCGDTDVRELDSLSVKEMMKRIQDGAEKLREQEQKELSGTYKFWV